MEKRGEGFERRLALTGVMVKDNKVLSGRNVIRKPAHIKCVVDTITIFNNQQAALPCSVVRQCGSVADDSLERESSRLRRNLTKRPQDLRIESRQSIDVTRFVEDLDPYDIVDFDELLSEISEHVDGKLDVGGVVEEVLLAVGNARVGLTVLAAGGAYTPRNT